MQSSFAVLALFAAGASADDASKNPLGSVLNLLNELSAKVVKDGEAEEKAYKEYFEWCDDVSKEKQNEITTSTSQKNKLDAEIEELTANIEEADSQIATLTGKIATDTADLKAATFIREKESEEFVKSDKELADMADALTRAVTILEREMQKNPAALAQVANSGLSGLLQAMGVLLDAAAFPIADKAKITSLLQSQQGSDDEDGELGSPAAATYKSHSTGIFDVLEDMKEKAETELSDIRKAENTNSHNFKMLKQSLEDGLAADNKDLAKNQANKAADEESKAVAEGDLSVTNEDLKTANNALQETSSHCMTVAADHEATVRSMTEELKVIATALKILEESTGGAVDQTYSFLQMRTSADLSRNEVVLMVKKLAHAHHSAALAQLASRIAVVVKYGAGSSDPFVKIRGLIQDMIAKLQAEAQAEATEKAYCDEELAKTEAKKQELDSEIEGLTVKIDQAAAQSADLKKQVGELQTELATLAKEQSDRETWRKDENDVYLVAKADLEKGLNGVRKALDLLRSYYNGAALLQQDQPAEPVQHEKSQGAGDSIIGILEVCESDFADNLSKVETEEADAVATYEANTQENKITTAEKTQDVKYKTAEFTTLDKAISEHSSDRQTAETELSAVMEYYGKLKDRCIAKPETYEERSARRKAEIEGLKTALSVLENETALMQRGKKHRGSARHMRGALQL
jgi:chromosome segregation ATPase